MPQKAHQYRLTLEYLHDNQGHPQAVAPMAFTFTNHDDIFSIVTRMQDRQLFPEGQDAVEFAIGLKLFSEVMLRNRGLALFESIRPAFADFMKELKSGSGR